jgi:phage terminase large subunit-like protein
MVAIPSVAYKFDTESAERPIRFFREYLHHVKGEWAGQPFVLLPWQAELVWTLFGWRRLDGTRRYRTCYVEVPRKNGKSSLAACIGLYLLFADNEPGAEVYSAAADREQAAIVFDTARQMVGDAPALAKRSQTYRRSIIVPSTASSYKVLSSEAYTKDGLNAHGIIFDELHAQPNRELWDVLTTSVGARRQPLIFAITTAGYDRNSICWEVHDYACKVRDGIIQDDSFLPIIYAADKDDDWTNLDVLGKVNPSLGSTVKLEYLAQECRKAQETPGYQNPFKRLHLNIWTEQETRWLDMAKWDDCGGTLDPAELEGQPCYAGLDLSSTTDITALVLVFPQAAHYAVLSYFWVPAENIRRRAERDRVPYPLWAQQGHIEATEGNVVDYDIIRSRINELNQRYHIREIAIDRWNSTQLQTQLQGDGLTVVQFGQGFASMTGPSKELEKLVLGKRIQHGENPVLRWMVSNVAVRQDAAGNLKPDKEKSTEKIDGVVALIMGLGRALVQGQPQTWGYGAV